MHLVCQSRTLPDVRRSDFASENPSTSDVCSKSQGGFLRFCYEYLTDEGAESSGGDYRRSSGGRSQKGEG